MKCRKHIAIVAAATAILSSPALAAPTLNFSIETTALAKPTLEYEYQGGKYVWDQKAANTQFSASADTGSNKLLWAGLLHIDSLGVGGSAGFTGKVPSNVKNWTLSGPITFPIAFLNAYQANFASFCDKNGISKPLIKHGLSITFSARQAYLPKPKGWPNQVPQQVGSEKWATRTVHMPVKIVCGARPLPRPDAIAQEKGSLKVQSIALSFGGAQATKPNPATVCKQAKLTVTVKANQAGPVKFRLRKKIGNTALQTKAVDAWAKHDGKGFFFATYQELVQVTRTTGVQAMAEDLINPIGLSTSWKNVTLHCTGVGGGGLAGTPNTSDNQLPQAPKKPNRVFGGPSATRTHAPTGPSMAPANPKTGAGAPPRAFRHIGKKFRQ